MAVGAGFEPAHFLINNQAPYQLGHPTMINLISDCRLPISDSNPVHNVQNRQSTIGNRKSFGGPRGSRTHYLSIKSRELILMSFRPPPLPIADLRTLNPNWHSGIDNRRSTIGIFMLRPRFELGSRTDLVLAGYKPAALPIELPELPICGLI